MPKLFFESRITELSNSNRRLNYREFQTGSGAFHQRMLHSSDVVKTLNELFTSGIPLTEKFAKKQFMPIVRALSAFDNFFENNKLPWTFTLNEDKKLFQLLILGSSNLADTCLFLYVIGSLSLRTSLLFPHFKTTEAIQSLNNLLRNQLAVSEDAHLYISKALTGLGNLATRGTTVIPLDHDIVSQSLSALKTGDLDHPTKNIAHALQGLGSLARGINPITIKGVKCPFPISVKITASLLNKIVHDPLALSLDITKAISGLGYLGLLNEFVPEEKFPTFADKLVGIFCSLQNTPDDLSHFVTELEKMGKNLPPLMVSSETAGRLLQKLSAPDQKIVRKNIELIKVSRPAPKPQLPVSQSSSTAEPSAPISATPTLKSQTLPAWNMSTDKTTQEKNIWAWTKDDERTWSANSSDDTRARTSMTQ
jgi:hypothetical protein